MGSATRLNYNTKQDPYGQTVVVSNYKIGKLKCLSGTVMERQDRWSDCQASTMFLPYALQLCGIRCTISIH